MVKWCIYNVRYHNYAYSQSGEYWLILIVSMTTLHSPVATGPPWISYSCCWGSQKRSAVLRCAWETWNPRGTCLHQLCSQNLGIQIVASWHVSQTQGACRFCQAAEIGGIWRTLGEWQRVRESRETAYQFALGWDEIGEQEGGWEGGSLPPISILTLSPDL